MSTHHSVLEKSERTFVFFSDLDLDDLENPSVQLSNKSATVTSGIMLTRLL